MSETIPPITELLLGNITDTNATFLTQELAALVRRAGARAVLERDLQVPLPRLKRWYQAEDDAGGNRNREREHDACESPQSHAPTVRGRPPAVVTFRS